MNKRLRSTNAYTIWSNVYIRLVVISTLLIVIACGVYYFINPQANVDAAWYNDTWKFRKQLTINEAQVTGSSNLTNFPVLVSIKDADLNANAQTSGNDIVFTASDGSTKLDHEIEKFDSKAGELIAWVRIPTLSYNVDTVIFMYYGNKTASAQQNATGVWSSNYKAVWHLKEVPNVTCSGTDEVCDSTTNANNGNMNGSMPASAQVGGKIGNSIKFDGSNDYFSVLDSTSLDTLSSALTVSAWVNPDVLDSSYRRIIARGSFPSQQWFLENNGGSPGKIMFGAGSSNTSTGTIATGSWYYITMTINASNLTTYINGTQDSQFSGNGSIGTNGDVGIGADANASTPWNGKIDEVRLSNVVNSADWIRTEYNNQNSPSTFITLGQSQKNSGATANWSFDEGQGQTVNDNGGNSLNGTLGASTSVGADDPTWQTEDQCISGKCLLFDGSNDYLTLGNKQELAPTGAYTLSAWIKLTNNSATHTIMSKSGTSGNIGYSLNTNSSGKLYFEISSNGTTTASVVGATTLDNNKWYFVSARYTPSTSITLFLNGVQDATNTSSIPASQYASTADFNIGQTNPMAGFIDEVKFYPYARSATQIQADYIGVSSNIGANAVLGGTNSKALSDGLVGYWKMDEASWTNNCSTASVVDSSGNGNNGTACPNSTGPTGGVAGKFGLAGTFDGSNDYIDLPNSTTLKPTTTLTVSTWFTASSQATYTRILSAASTANVGYGFTLYPDAAGGRLQFDIGVNGGSNVSSNSGKNLRDGMWHNAIGTWDGTTMKLYIDGELQTATTQASGTISYSQHLILGANNSDSPANFHLGKIDEVRLYNRALSQQEANQLYTWSPEPQSYWNLDEGTGTSANDKSGGVTGTLANGPLWKNGKFGDSVFFDGVDDYINTNGQYNFTSANSFTISAWVKTTQNATSSIVSKGCGFVGTYAIRTIVNSGVNFCIHDSLGTQVNATSTTSLADNQWHYVAGVRDVTTGKIYIYVDGIEKANTSDTTTGNFSRANNVFIGKRPVSDAEFFNGTVDDVKIYNYARSAKQIIEDMNASHPVVGTPVAGPAGHWSFDEGYGTTARDNTPNANDLTLSTASWTPNGKFAKAWNGTGSNWVSRADDDDFDFAASDDFSLSTWFKSDSASNPATIEYILGKGGLNTGYALFVQTNGTIVFGIDDDGTFSPKDAAASTIDLYDNNWHNAIAVKQGTSRIDLYIDGVLVASDTSIATTGTLANANSLIIGSGNTTNDNDDFNGDIDEVKIYRAALTADQVKAEFNQGKTEVLGSLSTNASNTAPDNSASRAYCVPGDTDTCNPPIAEWNFSEGNGSTVNDTSGNNYSGSWSGSGNHWVPGKIGKAGKFNGSDDYVNVSSVSALNASTITVCAWAKRTGLGAGTSYQYIVAKGSYSTNGYALILEPETTTIRWRVDTAGVTGANDITASATTTNWNYYCGTYNGSESRLYVNGVLASSATVTYTPPINQSFRIGSSSGSDGFFEGLIDEVKVYDRARSPAQIAWDYNRGAPAARWEFDECTGSTVYDSSGNGLNLTIVPGASGNTATGSCNSGTSTQMWHNGTVGKFNSGLGFDGIDDYAQGANSSIYNQSTLYGISLSAWIYRTGTPDASNGGGIAGKWSSNNGFLLWLAPDNSLQWALGGGPHLNSSVTAQLNTWYHVVGTYEGTLDGSGSHIYINGKRTASTTDSFSNTSAVFEVGRYAETGSTTFPGIIDDVQFFTYKLNAKQVEQLYNGSAAVRFAPQTGSP